MGKAGELGDAGHLNQTGNPDKPAYPNRIRRRVSQLVRIGPVEPPKGAKGIISWGIKHV